MRNTNGGYLNLMSEKQLLPSKTWKREVSLVLLGFLGYLLVYDKLDAAALIVTPTFGFAMMAFGIDWWGKNPEILNKFGRKPD